MVDSKIVVQLTPQEIIEQEFGKDSIMVEIAKAESRFVPTAQNASSMASGLFQILNGTWDDYGCAGDVFDAKDNVACARKVYDKRGTRDWDSSKSVWGKKNPSSW